MVVADRSNTELGAVAVGLRAESARGDQMSEALYGGAIMTRRMPKSKS